MNTIDYTSEEQLFCLFFISLEQSQINKEMQGRETSLYTISISGHLYLDESSTVSAGIYSLPFIITISPTSTWKKTGNWLMVSNKIYYTLVLSTVNIYLLNLLARLLETHTLREVKIVHLEFCQKSLQLLGNLIFSKPN